VSEPAHRRGRQGRQSGHLALSGEPVEAAAPPEFRHTEVGEFRIHSEHQGTGPPVVLLHGLSGSRRWWRFTVPALARRYRVHVPELIGFGRSRGAIRQPPIQEMAGVVSEWMQAVDAGDARLVGHSMGGQIALHVAVEAAMPRQLVLVSASGLPRAWTLAEAARFVSGALPPRAWGSPSFVPIIAADAVRAGPRALLKAFRHVLSDDVSPLLERITCPTLLIWGALDPLIPLAHGEAMAGRIPGARLVVLPDAAHNAMADRPTEFNRILLDFLDRP
jgi:pimeloyl-ACP methyl ester carboxylesterase